MSALTALLPAADRIARVAVVVPARNEEELISSCLDGLLTAGRELSGRRPEIDIDLIVVADRCTDATEQLVREHGLVPVRSDHGNVGGARAHGVLRALARARRAGVVPAQLWLAGTDADSIVPPHWLSTQVEFAEAGTDAVIGTVEPRDVADSLVLRRWHDRHDLREGHGYVHGANLGMRASTYLAAAGFPHTRRDEDVALVEAIRRRTDRWIATDSTRVSSSGRLTGRCEGGFADYLAGLAADVTGGAPPVTAP